MGIVKAVKKALKAKPPAPHTLVPNQLYLGGSGIGCGVYNLTGVSVYGKVGGAGIAGSSDVILHHFAQKVLDWGRVDGEVIILWSDRVDVKGRDGAQKLADLMRESGMAKEVIETVETGNFNYVHEKGHVCKVFAASLAFKEVVKWAKENGVEKTPPRNNYYNY